jgi:hypothetical protein
MGDVFGSRTRDWTPRTVAQCLVPKSALLQRYVGEGSYVDCYTTDIATPVSQAEFVEAFYTTPVFRLERLILRWAVSKPSTDDEARALATRRADSFAAWTVEERTENQVLLCDFVGRTRSWLMAEPLGVAQAARERGCTLGRQSSLAEPRGTDKHDWSFASARCSGSTSSTRAFSCLPRGRDWRNNELENQRGVSFRSVPAQLLPTAPPLSQGVSHVHSAVHTPRLRAR